MFVFFFHRMLQEHDSCQNDSCDSLTYELLSAPDYGDRKAVLDAQRRRKQGEQTLASKMKRLSLSPPQTTARRVNPMPTWGQLKKLTREAEGLVQRTGNKLSSETMFLAMLALRAMQVTAVAGEFLGLHTQATTSSSGRVERTE